MTDATKDNPEAYKLMQKANAYNNIAKASLYVGMGGTILCSVIYVAGLQDTQGETTFSDVAPSLFFLGVWSTTFIWRGLAVSNLKKAVVANRNSPQAQLYLAPSRVGIVVRF